MSRPPIEPQFRRDPTRLVEWAIVTILLVAALLVKLS